MNIEDRTGYIDEDLTEEERKEIEENGPEDSQLLDYDSRLWNNLPKEEDPYLRSPT